VQRLACVVRAAPAQWHANAPGSAPANEPLAPPPL